jgi:cell division protein FtsI (penicillin-binding protein 3)
MVMLLAIAFVLTLFGGRLVQLQGMEAGTFSKLARDEQVKTEPLPGVRGFVVDDTGHPLVMTLETFTVTAAPAQMMAAKMPQYASQLAGPLGLTSQQVLAMLQDPAAHGGSGTWMVLSPQGGVSAAVSDEITALDIPSITLGAIYTPVYPDGDATLNVAGYATGQVTDQGGIVSGAITGKAGIESQHNTLLSGRDGSQVVYLGTDNEPIPLEGGSLTPATNGSDIKLTINSDLQYYAQEACERQVKAMHARDCTVVVMRPGTGDILAMAQWPQYCTPALSSCPASSTTGTDLPVGATFAPGSTAKVITAAAALEQGGQTPMSAYYIPSVIYEGGQAIRDAENDGGSHYTIAGIIAHSSNIGMAQVAKTITPRVEYNYLRAFGLGQSTGLDLQGESPGILAPPSQWAPDERYTLAYGQGIAVTALQMASVYATIANGGVRVQPRIVAGTTSPTGKFTAAAASPSRRVIQASTAHELIQILQQVPGVDESAGVAWGIIPGYAIASKTGTANENGPECPATNQLCEYGSSYIGMAPGNAPQVVVAVNVQDPDKKDAYFGDEVAGPVFNQVMKFAVQTLQIPPDDSTVPYVRLNAP